MVLEEIKKTAIIILASLVMLIVSGLGMGGIYYVMDVTEDNLQGVSCTISNNVFVDDCQELFDLALYPFLALRDVLVIFNAIFIVMLTAGMLMLGYQSGKAPWTIGLFILFSLVLTYGALEVANMYMELLTNDIIYDAMVSFTIYNKVMLNFPWYVFFVSIVSTILSVVNYQKPVINRPRENIQNY